MDKGLGRVLGRDNEAYKWGGGTMRGVRRVRGMSWGSTELGGSTVGWVDRQQTRTEGGSSEGIRIEKPFNKRTSCKHSDLHTCGIVDVMKFCTNHIFYKTPSMGVK